MPFLRLLTGTSFALAALLALHATLVLSSGFLGPDAAGARVGLACVALYVLVAAAAVTVASRRRWMQGWLAIAAWAWFVATRILWVTHVDSYQTGDFGMIFRCGAYIAGFIDGDCRTLFGQRALLYSAIAARLFGPTTAGIEIFNVILQSAMAAAFAVLVRRLYGDAVTAFALLVLTIHPDLFYSTTLASHDNSGMTLLAVFYLTGFILLRLFDRVVGDANRPAQRRPALVVGLAGVACATGLLLCGLDLTRSYHVPALLALLVQALYVGVRPAGSSPAGGRLGRRRLLAAGLVFVLIPAMVDGAAKAVTTRLASSVMEDFMQYEAVAFATAAEIDSSGSYLEISRWARYQYPLLHRAGRTRYAVVKAVSELTHDPLATLAYFARKNARLALGDGALDFSTTGETGTNEGNLTAVNDSYLPEQRGAANGIALILLVMLCARLALTSRLPWRREDTLMNAFSLGLYAMLLFLGEAQPRYDVFLAFPLSISAGLLVCGVRRPAGEVAAARPGVVRGAVLGSAVLAGLVLALVVASWIVRLGHLGLEDMTAARPATAEELARLPHASPWRAIAPSKTLVKTRFDRAWLLVSHDQHLQPGDTAGLTLSIPLAGRRPREIELFLSNTEAVYWCCGEYPHKHLTLDYGVYADGTLVASGPIVASLDPVFVTAPIAPTGEALDLSVVVRFESAGEIKEEMRPVIIAELLNLRS